MDNKAVPLNQLILTDRKLLQANGIIEVESFDEKQIAAVSQLGQLLIKGEALHIVQLNLDEGKMVIDGEIGTILYAENKSARMKAKGRGIMERLFR